MGEAPDGVLIVKLFNFGNELRRNILARVLKGFPFLRILCELLDLFLRLLLKVALLDDEEVGEE
jgi:hypothetical protein